MRASIMGPLRYAFSNSPVASWHSDLSVLARSTKNGLGSSPVGSFKKLTKRIVGASHRGALQVHRAHLAENAARGPRCEARILGALG